MAYDFPLVRRQFGNHGLLPHEYVDWQFDGDDVIAVCRASWNGVNYHDANHITFHRVRHFRTLTLADSPPPVGQ